MSRRRGRAGSVAMVLVTLAAGCGDDGGDGSDGTAPRATTSTTAGADLEADQALAAAALLTLDDLPDGWTADPDAPSDAEGEEAFARLCEELVDERDAINEEAGGDPPEAEAAFVGGAEGLPTLRDDVTVFPDDELAGQAFDLATSDGYESCVAEAFVDPASRPDPSVVYGEPEIATLSLASAGAVGDEMLGVRISAPVTSAGASFVVRLDVVALRIGRVLHQMVFGGADLMPLADSVRDAALVAAADFEGG